jgi:hypothetical protein
MNNSKTETLKQLKESIQSIKDKAIKDNANNVFTFCNEYLIMKQKGLSTHEQDKLVYKRWQPDDMSVLETLIFQFYDYFNNHLYLIEEDTLLYKEIVKLITI